MSRWRYKLPCGHHNFRRVNGNKSCGHKKDKHYRCMTCDKRFEYKIDKKESKKVYVE